MTTTFNSFFVFVGLLFGKEKAKSFADDFSFPMPKSYKVLWHRVIQPVREAPWYSKPASLFVRSDLAMFCVWCLTGLSCLFASVLFLWHLVGKLDVLAALQYLLVAALLAALTYMVFWVAVGQRVWAKISFGSSDCLPLVLYSPRKAIPTFVFERMDEITKRVIEKKGQVKFEAFVTTVDPIVYAIVNIDGVAERFAFAVFDFGVDRPLCE